MGNSGDRHEPPWLLRVTNSIQHLADLPAGWDSYGAAPISMHATQRCIESVLAKLPQETPEPTVVPTREGGIQLEWHYGRVDFEIGIPPAGPISYLLVDGNGEEYEWEGPPASHTGSIQRAIAQLRSAG